MRIKNLLVTVIVGFFMSSFIPYELKAHGSSFVDSLTENCVEGFRHFYNSSVVVRILTGYALGNALKNLLFGGMSFLSSLGQKDKKKILWAVSVLSVIGFLTNRAKWRPHDKWNTGSLSFNLASIFGFFAEGPLL